MKKILLIGLILLLTACGQKYQVINANTAKELIDNGATLIDVRTEEEYDESHIEGATNIPLQIIDSINYPLDNVIVLYCATGIRSAEAAKILVEKGYTREDAYKTVQAHALKALEGADFKEELLNDTSVTSKLTPNEIEKCFNPQDYLGNINKVFARFE